MPTSLQNRTTAPGLPEPSAGLKLEDIPTGLAYFSCCERSSGFEGYTTGTIAPGLLEPSAGLGA